jgi:hypothetical protein
VSGHHPIDAIEAAYGTGGDARVGGSNAEGVAPAAGRLGVGGGHRPPQQADVRGKGQVTQLSAATTSSWLAARCAVIGQASRSALTGQQPDSPTRRVGLSGWHVLTNEQLGLAVVVEPEQVRCDSFA